jgi:hypothetical protein
MKTESAQILIVTAITPAALAFAWLVCELSKLLHP